MWVKRLQVPVSPAFALTEYKVQGSTYQNVVLDLHRPSKPHGQDSSHKQYCSVYVQLTRPRSLKGLHLLQPLSLDNLGNQLHPKLQDEDHRLQRLVDMMMRLETLITEVRHNDRFWIQDWTWESGHNNGHLDGSGCSCD